MLIPFPSHDEVVPAVAAGPVGVADGVVAADRRLRGQEEEEKEGGAQEGEKAQD